MEEQKYTCPMHPEVVKDEPGRCPKCRMNLVPIEKSGEVKSQQSHSHEHAPALAQSNVGIDMGTGTYAAIQSAGYHTGKRDLFVLYPFFGLLLSPMLTTLAMRLSSVSVVLNSLRLRALTI